jgi:hypothetical protein
MPYLVLLFDSVNAALLAERILKEEGITHKLIPVPRSVSTDCGVCIRIGEGDQAHAEATLRSKVKIHGVHRVP